MRKKGYFGNFGGQYVPELLMPALIELEEAYQHYSQENQFQSELNEMLKNYSGRPTPIYYAKNLSDRIGGAKLLFKREDLNHTGSHKLNNCLGQALLAKKMNKKNIIAETGAGQHGVATATVCALLGIHCKIFMGDEDIKRQQLNVYRMKMLGAEVVPVHSGTATLKDATSEAMRNWVFDIQNTHFLIGSVVGPHPFPTIVRDFQSIIGKEALQQLPEFDIDTPDYIVACVGGGSNSIGIFYPFLNKNVKLIGVEAGGVGTGTGQHAASLSMGEIGVFHGKKSYFLQDKDGQIIPAHSISAGLDYPGVGPEHSYLKDSDRAQYVSVTDEEAVKAFMLMSKNEGIIPALESAHAISYALELASTLTSDKSILVNLSGRGDKDINSMQKIN